MVEILCCDTTASNMGRLNGVCVLLEQKLKKDLLYFPCRHHILELVLRSIFEIKLPQVTRSPDVPIFKKFREYWPNINSDNFLCGMDDQYSFSIIKAEKIEITEFCTKYLQNQTIVRNEYRELLELTIIFLNGDSKNKIKIRPPGAIHQAR